MQERGHGDLEQLPPLLRSRALPEGLNVHVPLVPRTLPAATRTPAPSTALLLLLLAATSVVVVATAAIGVVAAAVVAASIGSSSPPPNDCAPILRDIKQVEIPIGKDPSYN